MNGAPTSDDDLVRLTKEALVKTPDVRVVISADGEVRHRRVIHTLDLVKRAGVARVAFGALPAEQGDGAP